MLEKEVRDAIARIYALNDEVDDNTFIYAFPPDMLLITPLITAYSDSIENVYVLPENDKDEDSTCVYLIAQAKTEEGGTIIFAFTSGSQVDVTIKAIKDILTGKSSDQGEI